MNTNEILNTAVVRKQKVNTQHFFFVRSPLCDLVAQGKDRQGAIAKYLQVLALRNFPTQASVEQRGRGRPTKNYDSLHVQVPAGVKSRLQEVSERFSITQGEAINMLLNAFELLESEFVPKKEVDEARASAERELQATAG